MGGDGYKKRLHVVGQCVGAAEQQGMGAGAAQQGETRARREADAHPGMAAAFQQQALHVIEQGIRGVHAIDGLLQRQHVFGAESWQGLVDHQAAVAAGQHRAFGYGVRVAHRDAQQEAVELRVR